MNENTFTTAPVEASQAGDPEWLDLPGLEKKFGVKRSLAYLLIADGSIKSVSLRRHGALKGKRLILASSVRNFLNSRMG